jgi:DNA-binding transcriptional ArsR family regulator
MNNVNTIDTVELLLHPVRLRIVHAMSGGRTFTTAQLRMRMSDVSKATMYRHVALLAAGGILEVDGEQQVGGTVERRYRLCRSGAVIGAEAVAAASLEGYRRAFAVAMAALLGEFDAYLDRGSADPAADAVGFRQHSLWLSPRERDQLIADVRAAIVSRLKLEPAPGRRQHLLSPILFPIEEDIPGK